MLYHFHFTSSTHFIHDNEISIRWSKLSTKVSMCYAKFSNHFSERLLGHIKISTTIRISWEWANALFTWTIIYFIYAIYIYLLLWHLWMVCAQLTSKEQLILIFKQKSHVFRQINRMKLRLGERDFKRDLGIILKHAKCDQCVTKDPDSGLGEYSIWYSFSKVHFV